MRTIVCAALAACFALPAAADPIYLSGTIGNAPVFATVDYHGGSLTGWYVYLRHAKQIRLDGWRQGAQFQLDETEAASGRKTGTFKGVVSDGRWSGQWSDGKRSLPLALAEARDTLASASAHLACNATWHDRQFGYDYLHKVDLTVEKGTVKQLNLFRGETSKFGDDQSCSIDLSDLRQERSDAGILLRAKGGAESGGQCTIRILATVSGFYIRVGGEDGDCRGSGDAMFCSPRSFWTDVIVDRKTGTCKPVQ